SSTSQFPAIHSTYLPESPTDLVCEFVAAPRNLEAHPLQRASSLDRNPGALTVGAAAISRDPLLDGIFEVLGHSLLQLSPQLIGADRPSIELQIKLEHLASYLPRPLEGRCANAEAAAVFSDLVEFGLERTLEAAEAAFFPVTF